MQIVDAHLDLAYNVTRGRDPRLPARRQPVADNEIATVGLPDLRAGGVDLICATIFCRPNGYGKEGYTTNDQAHAQAVTQLDWYRRMQDDGELQIARGVGILPALQRVDARGRGAGDTSVHAILLLEGADALRSPNDVQEFFDAGVRIIGLSWRNSFYAGGTGHPGPITEQGVALVREFDRFGIIHDMSHLSDESFFQLLDLTGGPVMASHSNCRAIVGEGDRHLTDAMIRTIITRDGVIGINFYDQFLLPVNEYGKRRATLNDVVVHMKHICDLAGNANHVGLGTDMDGGLGRNEIPVEIETSADLPRVGDALHDAGFGDADIRRILALNWAEFFARAASRFGASD